MEAFSWYWLGPMAEIAQADKPSNMVRRGSLVEEEDAAPSGTSSILSGFESCGSFTPIEVGLYHSGLFSIERNGQVEGWDHFQVFSFDDP